MISLCMYGILSIIIFYDFVVNFRQCVVFVKFIYFYVHLIADSSAANAKSLLLKKPKLSDIHRLTQPVSSKWNLIGRELDVCLNFRQELRSNSETNDDRLELVLHQWLQSSTDPPTWSSFLNALERAKLNEICRCTKEYLETPEAKRLYS